MSLVLVSDCNNEKKHPTFFVSGATTNSDGKSRLLETEGGVTFHQSRLWHVWHEHEMYDSYTYCFSLACGVRHTCAASNEERAASDTRVPASSEEINRHATNDGCGKTTCPRQWTGRGTLRHCTKFWSVASTCPMEARNSVTCSKKGNLRDMEGSWSTRDEQFVVRVLDIALFQKKQKPTAQVHHRHWHDSAFVKKGEPTRVSCEMRLARWPQRIANAVVEQQLDGVDAPVPRLCSSGCPPPTPTTCLSVQYLSVSSRSSFWWTCDWTWDTGDTTPQWGVSPLSLRLLLQWAPHRKRFQACNRLLMDVTLACPRRAASCDVS